MKATIKAAKSERLIGITEVKAITGISAVTAWRRYTATPPTFPAPAGYVLGARKWRMADVESWLAGELEARPAVSRNLSGKRPAPPDWVTGAARAEWIRVVRLLARRKLLDGIDRTLLEHYCIAYATKAAARIDVVKNGHTFQTPFGAKLNPNSDLARRTGAELRRLASELGLSPTSRDPSQKKRSAPPRVSDAEIKALLRKLHIHGARAFKTARAHFDLPRASP